MSLAEFESLKATVLVAIFLLAALLGFVMRETRFCTMGAISDVVYLQDWTRVRQWCAAIAVAMLGFAALAHGVDISVMSLTKHVSGHSDCMMGSASAGPELYAKLRVRAQGLGNVVSPDDASLMLRGLRTMKLRLEAETASALAVAQWLSSRAEVARVLCPMLAGSPGHELWARDFTGGCGLFSFVLKGGTSAARDALIDALDLFGIGYSWGGFESLATPVDPAGIRTASAWPLPGMEPGDAFGVRLSIGLEDTADLIADLDRGLAAWAAHGGRS